MRLSERFRTHRDLSSCPITRTSEPKIFFFFFFNDTATTEIYTFSLPTPLPIKHTRKFFREPFILAEEIPDLAPAYADVARRHIGMRTNVAKQLGHEGLTKPHHLSVAFSFWIEV